MAAILSASGVPRLSSRASAERLSRPFLRRNRQDRPPAPQGLQGVGHVAPVTQLVMACTPPPDSDLFEKGGDYGLMLSN